MYHFFKFAFIYVVNCVYNMRFIYITMIITVIIVVMVINFHLNTPICEHNRILIHTYIKTNIILITTITHFIFLFIFIIINNYFYVFRCAFLTKQIPTNTTLHILHRKKRNQFTITMITFLYHTITLFIIIIIQP